jgi:hypothetical protein
MPNAKWKDPVGRSLRAILTCIHAGLQDVKPKKTILSQSFAMIYGSMNPCLPDPVTHCWLGYTRSARLATPSEPQSSTWVSIIDIGYS